MSDPEIAAFFSSLDTIASTGPAAGFGRLLDAEGAKWATAVKASVASLE
jgi:hypothetical protein